MENSFLSKTKRAMFYKKTWLFLSFSEKQNESAIRINRFNNIGTLQILLDYHANG